MLWMEATYRRHQDHKEMEITEETKAGNRKQDTGLIPKMQSRSRENRVGFAFKGSARIEARRGHNDKEVSKTKHAMNSKIRPLKDNGRPPSGH